MNHDLIARLGSAIEGLPEKALAVAVSGGGDSIALLHLLAARGPVEAVTVNHNLRPEAAQEIALVAQHCAGLGVRHHILEWHWDGQGNLQARARIARRKLIAEWAAPRGITHVALAHTADDQAETVLMRLAREAGVDGLSGMAHAARAEGLIWLRPLLRLGREDLRSFLRGQGLDWAEDPSNDDLQFDRVKARKALDMLEPLGITRAGLTRVADQMAEARQALNLQLAAVVREHVQQQLGDLVFYTEALQGQPPEIYRRFLGAAIRWVSGGDYAPRRATLARVQEDIAAARPSTVQGCHILPGRRTRITRELRAVEGVTAPMGEIWDRRWRANGPASDDLEVRALGADGQAQCPALREAGIPHAARLSLPGLWRGGKLVAAPLSSFDGPWRVELAQGPTAFVQSLQSH